jgi:hypothetical protein
LPLTDRFPDASKTAISCDELFKNENDPSELTVNREDNAVGDVPGLVAIANRLAVVPVYSENNSAPEFDALLRLNPEYVLLADDEFLTATDTLFVS